MAPWLLAVVVVWPTARPAGAVGVGQAAPEISAKNWINSEEPLALKNLKDKVVVVSFWLSSNPDCRRSIPVLKRLHHAHGSRGLVVIGLSNESTSTVRAYVKQTGMNYAVGANSTSAAAYGVRSTPYAYVVKQGQVIWAGNPLSGLGAAVSQALTTDVKWEHPNVAVFVNDDIKITMEEFQAQLNMRQIESGRPVDKNLKQSVIYGLASQKMVERALETKRVKTTEQEIDAFYGQIRKEAKASGQMPQGQTFVQALQQLGMTVKRVRQNIRIGIGLEKLAAVGVDAAAVKEAFQRDAAKYQHVRARHILIRTQGLDQEQKAEARRKIAVILKRVKRGEDFATLAGNFSACPSKARGGDLGLIRRGRRVPAAFEKAAFALKLGETSKIVETRHGLHIIQTTERSLTFDKLKDEVRRQLVGKKISLYMRVLMKNVTINANPEL